MAKVYLLICLNLLICTCIKAQLEKIDPERPDQTESADLIAKKVFQAEFGFNKENTSDRDYDLLYPTALFKYGLGKIELRMETVVRSSYQRLIPGTKKETGFDPITLGFKINLAKEKNFLPKTSLISSFGIPAFSSEVFRTDHIAPSIKLVMINTFSEHADLSYNIGAEWDGISTTPAWLYTLSQGFSFGKNWNTYIEVFGFMQKNESPQHSIDAGIGYCISNDTKVDLSGGFGISDAALKNYIAIGFSFRIKTNSGN
jgi:hypothetical protein